MQVRFMIDKTFDYKNFEKKYSFDIESQQRNAGGQPFMILLPPPNVTGSLHIGHALCYTLQDIIARYKRMRGYDVLFQPGLDHAGIVTQLLVERQLSAKGIDKKELGREKFIEEIWKWKKESGDTILNQMKILGISCDFSKLHFTMDEDIQRAVSSMFVKLYNDGLIFKGRKLVNWDPSIQSAVSDLEVVEKESEGHLWHIRYQISNSSESIVVATTRPETMFGDSGIAVHPADERYQHLIGKMAILPVVEREIPIIADEYADPSKGTGAVKITPAHDFNDFEVGRRNNLQIINILSEDAKLNESVPDEFIGLDRFEARKKVVEKLEELGILVTVDSIKHKIPYSERSGSVIEPYVTDQWFIDAEKLAPAAIDAISSKKTKFVPEHWENLYFEWMNNIRPWCISRQIWWGHRIPAWYGEDGHIFVQETEQQAYDAARAFYNKNDVILTRDDNVLDTWFSSGMWPFSVLGWPNKNPDLEKYYGNAVVITGFDIIFFWVARMMMFGLHTMKTPPFKDIYIHGLVRDAKGQKMSKSKGNVIDPLVMSEKYGVDALRFTLAYLTAPGRDLKINDAAVENSRNFLTKIWNAVRFSQMSGCTPNTGAFNPNNVHNKIAQWLIVEIKNAQKDIETALDNYRFDDATKAIYKLIWGIFCDWYLELIKPEIQKDGQHKQEILQTTSWALEQITSMLYIVSPFIASELHAAVSELDIKWPEFEVSNSYHDSANEVNFVRSVVSEIRSIRRELDIPPSQIICVSCEALSSYEDILKRIAKVQLTGSSNNGIPLLVGNNIVHVLIRDIIDIRAEVQKMNSNLKQLDLEKSRLEQRLSNQGFLAKASDDVVEEHKSRLNKICDRIEKSTTLLRQIEKMMK